MEIYILKIWLINDENNVKIIDFGMSIPIFMIKYNEKEIKEFLDLEEFENIEI